MTTDTDGSLPDPTKKTGSEAKEKKNDNYIPIDLSPKNARKIINDILNNSPTRSSGFNNFVILSESSRYIIRIAMSPPPIEEKNTNKQRMQRFKEVSPFFSADEYPSEENEKAIIDILLDELKKRQSTELENTIHLIEGIISRDKITPLISFQHNWCHLDNGSYFTLDKINTSPQTALSSNATFQLILNLVRLYALSSSHGLTVWDTKLDNLMCNTEGKAVVIDLSCNTTRLPALYNGRYIPKDPKHDEKLRLAFIIEHLINPSAVEKKPSRLQNPGSLLEWSKNRKRDNNYPYCINNLLNALHDENTYLKAMALWEKSLLNFETSLITQIRDSTGNQLNTLFGDKPKKIKAAFDATRRQCASVLKERRRSSLGPSESRDTSEIDTEDPDKLKRMERNIQEHLAEQDSEKYAELMQTAHQIFRESTNDELKNKLNLLTESSANELTNLSSALIDKSKTQIVSDERALTQIFANSMSRLQEQHNNDLKQRLLNQLNEMSKIETLFQNTPTPKKKKSKTTPVTHQPTKTIYSYVKALEDISRDAKEKNKLRTFIQRHHDRRSAITWATLCCLFGASGLIASMCFYGNGGDPIFSAVFIGLTALITLMSIWPSILAEQGNPETAIKRRFFREAISVIRETRAKKAELIPVSS